LPGPIRSSASRSMRTLREGSDEALDFDMGDLLSATDCHYLLS
jgi:hypothetical protein